MTHVDLTPAARLVTRELAAAPCAVVAAAKSGLEGWRFGFGASQAAGGEGGAPRRFGLETPFDLASLTKPLTALAAARLERAGVLRRSEPLAEVLPLTEGTASAEVPLDLLLAHRAGLVAHVPFFEPLMRGERPARDEVLRRAADARRPECAGLPPPEGFAPVYSDLGYMLAGAAIEARTGEALDRVIAREVVAPLALAEGGGVLGSARQLGPGLSEAAAPTEVVSWRGGVLRGVVHDENAWLLAGDGSAGHAGMFGNAPAVVRLGCAVVDALAARSTWLAPSDMEPLVRARAGGSHAAGFDRRSGERPASGERFGPRTFGHLGFTGTSIWIDPEAALVGVLLTNRVHPTREHIAIRQARPAAYDRIHRLMCG